jgi:hypothetical protein
MRCREVESSDKNKMLPVLETRYQPGDRFIITGRESICAVGADGDLRSLDQ